MKRRGNHLPLAGIFAAAIVLSSCQFLSTLFYTQQSIGFDGFNVVNSGSLILGGTATIGWGVLQLVPSGQASQLGTAFLQTTIQATSGFSTRFQFQFSDVGGSLSDGTAVGGDGLTFAIQSIPGGNAPAQGTTGDGIGYGGIDRSIAIKFDTFQDSGSHDPSSNYIGVAVNGDMDNADFVGGQAPMTPDFDNGDIWSIWIDYDGATLSVYAVDGQTGAKPAVPSLKYDLDARSVFSGAGAYAGFTAAGGRDWEQTTVLSWKFWNYSDPSGT